MKKQTLKLDSNAISADFEAFCKKHKLPKVALIIEHGVEVSKDGRISNNLTIGTHSKNKKTENELLYALKELFCVTALNKDAIKITSDLIKEESKRRELAQREKKLSKEDRLKLLDIREKKNNLVLNKEYDKASKMRARELRLLGYKPEKKSPTSTELGNVLNYKPTEQDLKAVADKLTAELKKWKFNESQK